RAGIPTANTCIMGQLINNGQLITKLTFGELEFFACTGLAVLFALHHAVVAGQQLMIFQYAVPLFVVIVECARQCVLHRARLAGNASSAHRYFNIKLSVGFSYLQWKGSNILMCFCAEIIFQGTLVYSERSRSRLY